AFARLLATTVLRRLGQLDALIDACLERPLKPKLAGARDLMRLGAAQLLFLGTPAHAAVDSTVRLARGPRAAGYRGLVNAVLRRLARQGAGLLADQSPARLNTPDWLWDSWVAAHGDSATRAIAEAHLGEPPLDLSVADPAARAEWAARLDAAVLPTGTVRLAPGHGDVARLPGYDEGGWWVQDAAAALPARLLGDIAGRCVLDRGAAPGGKTMQLAAAGARVTALDISPRRVARLRENLARLGLAAETVVADAATWRPPALFDAVLLDAPCSATGTIRRHPDIARLKRPADVTALSAVQDRLLAAALAMVAPGGVLVYAACSLQSEEGAARIEALLARGAPAERDPIGAGEVGGLAEAITAEGDLRTLPCHLAGAGGMDGFHACRLRLRGRGHTVT
ncbi:MAG: transcription antitermination factor NusB, partial [Kiloniellaceae bacterium]